MPNKDELKEGSDIWVKGKVKAYRKDTKKVLVEVRGHIGTKDENWFEEGQYASQQTEQEPIKCSCGGVLNCDQCGGGGIVGMMPIKQGYHDVDKPTTDREIIMVEKEKVVEHISPREARYREALLDLKEMGSDDLHIASGKTRDEIIDTALNEGKR